MQGPSGRPVCTARGDAVLPLQARPPRSQRVSKLRWSQSLCFTASPAWKPRPYLLGQRWSWAFTFTLQSFCLNETSLTRQEGSYGDNAIWSFHYYRLITGIMQLVWLNSENDLLSSGWPELQLDLCEITSSWRFKGLVREIKIFLWLSPTTYIPLVQSPTYGQIVASFLEK